MLQRKPMNRGKGFARPAIERAPRAPVVPITEQRGVIRPVGDLVVAVPKEVLIDCRPYREYVAAQECFFCGIRDLSQCAHENFGKGKGIKVCDTRTFPACTPHGSHPGCHFLFDNYVDISRDEARVLGAELSARMRSRAAADGWTFTGTAILRPGVMA